MIGVIGVWCSGVGDFGVCVVCLMFWCLVCGVRCVVTGVRVWCVGAFGVRAVFSEWCMCGVCLVCGAFGVCVVCVMCSVCVWFVLCVFGVCVCAPQERVCCAQQ